MLFTRSTKIKQIRAIINTPPEPGATFWLFENGICHKYNERAGTWEPSTFERMKAESNKRSWLFLSGDDQAPVFKGHALSMAGIEETRKHLTRCSCSPDEIETRLKSHPDARKLADEVMKLFQIKKI